MREFDAVETRNQRYVTLHLSLLCSFNYIYLVFVRLIIFASMLILYYCLVLAKFVKSRWNR